MDPPTDSACAQNLNDCMDPVGTLKNAFDLNKSRTEESQKKTDVRIDEKFASGSSTSNGDEPKTAIYCDSFNGKNLISLAECKGKLAIDMSKRKKWMILIIVWLVQISMNLNCSLYSNAIGGIAEDFNRSENAARWGAAVFLIMYAFGCEIFALWSEELGRYWVLQTSLLLVNAFQFGVVFAKNLNTVIAFRCLGGLSTAGGSISLGIVADMFDKDNHQIPVAFIVFASVGGSVIGPIAGGFIEEFTEWQWAIYVQLIFGALVQALHFCFVPETRSTILIDRTAKQKRADAAKDGNLDLNTWGPNEVTPFAQRFSWASIFSTWSRPFVMFCQEPIVLSLSLLSGFSDALTFVFVNCLTVVYGAWGFKVTMVGLAFIPFLLGYLIAWLSFIPAIARNKKQRENNPTSERAQFESRLWWLLYTAPCLPIGLFGFAWTSGGPPLPWIASMIFTTLIGIANYAIYMATIDYMVTAYGPYSASATGGNGFTRDFLAGVLTPAALPFYNLPLGPKHIEFASTILAIIGTILVGCVYLIYYYGPWLRRKSKFAQKLERASRYSEAAGIVGVDNIPGGYGSDPASNLHSTEIQSLADGEKGLQSPLYRAGSQSTPDFLRLYVGFSRNVSPNQSRACSRNTSPSRANKGKRPAHVSRSQSLYHDKAQAEQDVTIDDPALIRTSQPERPVSDDVTSDKALTAAAAAPALNSEPSKPPKLGLSIPTITTSDAITAVETKPAASGSADLE